MRVSNLYISNSEKEPVTKKVLVKKLWPLALFVVSLLLVADYVYMKHVVFFNEWSNQGKVQRLLTNENPDEIPVFGASVARSSFTPDSISPDCYNYGMGKALYDVTRVLLKIECAKDKSSPIIFEVNPRTFIRNPEATINNSTFIPLLDYPVIENFMDESGLLSWHYKVPGLRLYGNYLYYTIGPLRRKSGDKKDNRGVMLETRTQTQQDVDIFVRRFDNINIKREELIAKRENPNKVLLPEEAYALHGLNSMVYFSTDSAYIAEFEEFIINNRQRKFILVTVPTNPLLKAVLPNFDEFVDFAEGLATKHSNVVYLDYSDFPTELDYYKDPTHFSEKGARIFSGHFAKDFERITGIRKDLSKAGF